LYLFLKPETMKQIFISFLFVTSAICVSAQTNQVPDKVQYQSMRAGIDFNSNFGGYNKGTLSRIFVGYHIDQSKKWGISPFFNIGANFMNGLKPDTLSIRFGVEPGLLSGFQNDHIGIKLFTSINLVVTKNVSNGLTTIPMFGINVGTGLKPIKKKLVMSAYAGVSPNFQGGPMGFIIGGNIGIRLRPITYVREY
jgi:hypothetical protein